VAAADTGTRLADAAAAALCMPRAKSGRARLWVAGGARAAKISNRRGVVVCTAREENMRPREERFLFFATGEVSLRGDDGFE
jgi:hypothetical protein